MRKNDPMDPQNWLIVFIITVSQYKCVTPFVQPHQFDLGTHLFKKCQLPMSRVMGAAKGHRNLGNYVPIPTERG